MKKIMISTLIVFLIAITAGNVRAETAAEKSGTAAEAAADAGLKSFAQVTPSAELIPDPSKVTFEKFDCPEGKFSAEIPAGWSQHESFPYGIDDTVSGVMLEGPQNPEGAPMTMAVLHYAGTGKIEGAQEYMKRVLANPTRTSPDQDITFTDIVVAGIKGTTFTFKKFHLVILPFDAPPMEEGVMYEMKPPSRRVEMTVRYIVIPAKPGFYSFMYEAPDDMYKDFSPVFDKVVNSFVLQEKK